MKAMKKLFAVIMVACLLMVAASAVYAQTYVNPTLVVENAAATAGETVDVKVVMYNNPGIVSMALDFEYDSSVLTLIDVTDSGNLGEANHSDNYSANPYTLTWSNDLAKENFIFNGEIVTLTFSVAANAVAKEYPVSVSYTKNNFQIFNCDGQEVDIDTVAGKVTIAAAPCTHSFTEKIEDADHLRSTAAKCNEHNTYWYDCAKCDVKSDSLYFDGAAVGPHNYTEKLEDATHLVPGSGADCQHAKEYYYDCADCDTMGSTTWAGTAVGPHSMSANWTTENSFHFHACTVTGCTHTADRVACSGGAASCTVKATCDTCGTPYGDTAPHAFNKLQTSDTQHWYKCANCDATDAAESHKGGAATCQDKARCTVCNTAYGDLGDHDYTKLQASDTQHWYKCANCDATDAAESHKGGDATCQDKAKCTVCDTAYGDLDAHLFGDAWITDDSGHWHVCKYCSETTAPETHTGVKQAEVPAEIDKDGRKAHYVCVCGKLFADEACTQPVTLDSLRVPALTPPPAPEAAPAPETAPAPAAPTVTSPDTGDDSNVVLYSCLLLAALGCAAVLLVKRKRIN